VLQPQPVTLQNPWVRLEPTIPSHAAGLAAVADVETFRFFTAGPEGFDKAGFEGYIAYLDRLPDVAFTVLTPEGEIVGMSTYMDIRTEHAGLEIGRTWYTKAARGTKINPAAKLLLLEHAFEILGAERVQLKTDRRNLQSQAALKKLGAQFEGFLRKHIVMPDGYLRDTAMFSVIREEWPALKASLNTRLQAE
jgi:RimJ/RimL family protein N-acetyltransferase